MWEFNYDWTDQIKNVWDFVDLEGKVTEVYKQPQYPLPGPKPNYWLSTSNMLGYYDGQLNSDGKLKDLYHSGKHDALSLIYLDYTGDEHIVTDVPVTEYYDIEFKFFVSDLDEIHTLIASSVVNELQIRVNGSGTLQVLDINVVGIWISKSGIIETDTVYKVRVRGGTVGSEITVTLDGDELTPYSTNDSMTLGTTGIFHLGHKATATTEILCGSIWDVHFRDYDTEETIAFFPCGENSGDTAFDSTGTYTGTLTNFDTDSCWIESVEKGHDWNDEGVFIADGKGTANDGVYLPVSLADTESGTLYKGPLANNLRVYGYTGTFDGSTALLTSETMQSDGGYIEAKGLVISSNGTLTTRTVFSYGGTGSRLYLSSTNDKIILGNYTVTGVYITDYYDDPHSYKVHYNSDGNIDEFWIDDVSLWTGSAPPSDSLSSDDCLCFMAQYTTAFTLYTEGNATAFNVYDNDGNLTHNIILESCSTSEQPVAFDRITKTAYEITNATTPFFTTQIESSENGPLFLAEHGGALVENLLDTSDVTEWITGSNTYTITEEDNDWWLIETTSSNQSYNRRTFPFTDWTEGEKYHVEFMIKDVVSKLGYLIFRSIANGTYGYVLINITDKTTTCADGTTYTTFNNASIKEVDDYMLISIDMTMLADCSGGYGVGTNTAGEGASFKIKDARIYQNEDSVYIATSGTAIPASIAPSGIVDTNTFSGIWDTATPSGIFCVAPLNTAELYEVAPQFFDDTDVQPVDITAITNTDTVRKGTKAMVLLSEAQSTKITTKTNHYCGIEE